ncbi:MAG: hypothetical protein R2857_07475 [Vampirovibrionales bacterium]
MPTSLQKPSWLTKFQITQQATLSILAQANMAPQGALTLLR